jgi:Dolichyl-phosphate-mannose-protein mannosyltransferase
MIPRGEEVPMPRIQKSIGASHAEWSASRSAAALLVVLFFAALRSTLLSISKPFWFDELCTVFVSRLPNASAIWDALLHGADGQPLPYYLLERLFHRLVLDDHLAYRLPSILAFLATVTFVYLILAKRVSRAAALVGASFVLCTSAADYAAEARPYALLVMCISAAIFSWERIDGSKLYAVLTAISLAAAASLHYYAVLVWPAFVLAEASVLVTRRRLRWTAWLAFLLGAAPILFFAPVLVNLRHSYAAHFSSMPTALEIFFAHDWFFHVSAHWGWSFAVFVTVFLLLGRIRPGIVREARILSDGGTSDPPLEDLILGLALLWLPIVAIAAAKFGHLGMSLRYMLPAAIGGALALGYAIDKAPLFWRQLLFLLLLAQYAAPALSQVKSALQGTLLKQRSQAAHEVQEIVSKVGDPGLPVVISDGLQYLPTLYYTPADLKARLFCIADPDAALLFSNAKSDSVDLLLRAQRRASLYRVDDYQEFLDSHPRFILVSSQDWDFQWLPAKLVHDGYALRLLSAEGPNLVFSVSAPSPPGQRPQDRGD